MQWGKNFGWEVLDGTLDDCGYSIRPVFSEQMPSIHPTNHSKIRSRFGFEDIPFVSQPDEDVELCTRDGIWRSVADTHVPVEIYGNFTFRRKRSKRFLSQIEKSFFRPPGTKPESFLANRFRKSFCSRTQVGRKNYRKPGRSFGEREEETSMSQFVKETTNQSLYRGILDSHFYRIFLAPSFVKRLHQGKKLRRMLGDGSGNIPAPVSFSIVDRIVCGAASIQRNVPESG